MPGRDIIRRNKSNKATNIQEIIKSLIKPASKCTETSADDMYISKRLQTQILCEGKLQWFPHTLILHFIWCCLGVCLPTELSCVWRNHKVIISVPVVYFTKTLNSSGEFFYHYISACLLRRSEDDCFGKWYAHDKVKSKHNQSCDSSSITYTLAHAIGRNTTLIQFVLSYILVIHTVQGTKQTIRR